MGFSGSARGKEPTCIRDVGLIPKSGRSPGGGNGNTLQYSCLKNLMDRGTWWAKSMGSQSWTPLSDWHTHTVCVSDVFHILFLTLITGALSLP